jgi:hypothetical protein
MVEIDDKVVLIPLEDGRYAVVKSDPVAIGDKVVTLTLKNGEKIAIKSQKVEVGDKVVVISTTSGNVGLKCIGIVDKSPEGSRISGKQGKI